MYLDSFAVASPCGVHQDQFHPLSVRIDPGGIRRLQILPRKTQRKIR